MTPGLLRPLTKSFDNNRGNNNSNNNSSNNTSTVNKSSHFESQHHFSWLHKKHHYSPVAQQQQQQQHHVPVSFNRPSGERRKAMTLGGWSNNILPGKALLFDKLAKLKKKTSQNATAAATATTSTPGSGHNSGKGLLFSGPQMSNNSHLHPSMINDDPLIVVCDFCTSSSSSVSSSTSTDVKEPEWLSGEKSVRFSLPESKKQVDPDERDEYWGYFQPPVNEIEKGHFSNSINRRKEKLYHEDLQSHSHLHNNNFCSEHPIRRNLSFGEGLNESLMTYHQYPPEPSSCFPCWCNGHGAPPIMMMPPPTCSSHCCPIQQQQQQQPRMLQCHHQNPFEERFSQYPSPRLQVRSNKSEFNQSKNIEFI